MKKELKKTIIDWMFENEKNFQLVNAAHRQFRPYIYDGTGEYLIGGEEVSEFIGMIEKLLMF